jgi:hypothetical protein
VTVSFDRPRKATVSVAVRAYIRPDIVVTPSSINFGSVLHGKRHECKVSIAYSGRPDWKNGSKQSGFVQTNQAADVKQHRSVSATG